jgi:hypothetical protein
MTGYHTRWVRPPDQAEDPERVAIREALAFGKAVYDQRRTLGLSIADLAERADMTADEIECIEEGCRASRSGTRGRFDRASVCGYKVAFGLHEGRRFVGRGRDPAIGEPGQPHQPAD